MALTDDLLAGLLARARGDTPANAAAEGTPQRRRSEEQEAPQSPFTVTQDAALRFELPPDDDANEAAVRETAQVTAPTAEP